MSADLLPIVGRKLLRERDRRVDPYAYMHRFCGTPEVFRPLVPPSRYKAARGGRGGAKSHFFGDLTLTRALWIPGLRVVCIREVQNSLKESVKRLLEDRISERKLGAHFESLETEIRTPGDGQIIFRGMQKTTANNIKSLEGYDIAWVEEAQTFSERSLTLLRPTIRKPGSELWFSWNPHLYDDPVEQFFCGPNGPPPGAVVITSSYRDNPFLSDESRKDLEWDRVHDPEKFTHVWEGGYEKHSEARVFKNWRVLTDEELASMPDPSWVPLYGGDWGFANDPTTLVKIYRHKRTLIVWAEAWEIGCRLDNTSRLFDRLDGGEARKHVIIADNARPESIDHLKHHGYPLIEPSVKGPNSVEEGVKFIQNLDVLVHPRCKHTIDELQNYKYKVDSLTGEVIPVLVDDSNHIIDSIRYALERERHAPVLKTGGGIIF